MQKYLAPLGGGITAVYTAITPAPPTYWLHSDWLGSARVASTVSQANYGDQAYGPFGESYNFATPGARLNVYTGQTQDLNSSSNVYDFLFRQYSSTQGRWMVPDPAGLAAVDLTKPQTWNRYAYLSNNPLNAVDPLGLYCAIYEAPDGSVGTWPGCGDDWGDFWAIFCCIGSGGGGGGGGRGGGGQPPVEPPPQQPINFPNETLGLPNGFPTSPWGVWGAIIPSGNCADIGPCLPIGNGFGPELAIPLCAPAPEVCGAIALGGLTIYAIEKYGPPLIHLIKDASSDLTKDHMQVCNFTGHEFEDPYVDPKLKICSYSCSDGQARTLPYQRGLACPSTQWFPK